MIPEPYCSIMPIFIIIGIGIVLKKIDFFSDSEKTFLSKLILSIALPSSFIACMVINVTTEMLVDLSIGLVIPVCAIGLNYLVSYVITKLLHINKKQQGLFICMFSNSNCLFIGLPVNIALFGTEAVPYAYIFYFISSTYFNTIGFYFMSKGKETSNIKKTLCDTIKTPIFISFVLAFILVFLHIPIPDFIIDSCYSLGNISTPLSLLYIGICISQMHFSKKLFKKEVIIIYLGRFIIAPLLTILICHFIPASQLAKNIFIVQSFLPTTTSIPIFSEMFDCDTHYAAFTSSSSALLSLGIIPLYTYLFFA